MSVSEVYRPETVITADISEHLIVPPLHSEELIVEEDILERAGVNHPVKINSSQIIFTLRLNLGLSDVHVIQISATQLSS